MRRYSLTQGPLWGKDSQPADYKESPAYKLQIRREPPRGWPRSSKFCHCPSPSALCCSLPAGAPAGWGRLNTFRGSPLVRTQLWGLPSSCQTARRGWMPRRASPVIRSGSAGSPPALAVPGAASASWPARPSQVLGGSQMLFTITGSSVTGASTLSVCSGPLRTATLSLQQRFGVSQALSHCQKWGLMFAEAPALQNKDLTLGSHGGFSQPPLRSHKPRGCRCLYLFTWQMEGTEARLVLGTASYNWRTQGTILAASIRGCWASILFLSLLSFLCNKQHCSLRHYFIEGMIPKKTPITELPRVLEALYCISSMVSGVWYQSAVWLLATYLLEWKF